MTLEKIYVFIKQYSTSYCVLTPITTKPAKLPEVICFVWTRATKATKVMSNKTWVTRASKRS